MACTAYTEAVSTLIICLLYCMSLLCANLRAIVTCMS
uniref:Uncharacterized protein n=1 Tax=Anguilla anguilla TaxID=7936 RepID=A0A0E9TTN2_ANGAN